MTEAGRRRRLVSCTNLKSCPTQPAAVSLASGVVGHAGVCTPSGPKIFTVNYAVVDEAIIFRTTPHSVLGSVASSSLVAFQVDSLDYEYHRGWSVLARPFYEERARLLPPGVPMVEGRAAIQAAQQRMIEGGVQALDLEAVDVIEAGEFAIEIGRTIVTIQPPGAPFMTMTAEGKSVVVWHRQTDGTLKIVVDTFNSDASVIRTIMTKNRRLVTSLIIALLAAAVAAFKLRPKRSSRVQSSRVKRRSRRR